MYIKLEKPRQQLLQLLKSLLQKPPLQKSLLQESLLQESLLQEQLLQESLIPKSLSIPRRVTDTTVTSITTEETKQSQPVESQLEGPTLQKSLLQVNAAEFKKKIEIANGPNFKARKNEHSTQLQELSE